LKYKNIKKKSSPEVYQDNLFLAVTDMLWEMIANADFSENEARKIIIRDTNAVIDESLRQAREDDY